MHADAIESLQSEQPLDITDIMRMNAAPVEPGPKRFHRSNKGRFSSILFEDVCAEIMGRIGTEPVRALDLAEDMGGKVGAQIGKRFRKALKTLATRGHIHMERRVSNAAFSMDYVWRRA
jgi:hypothetical protein